MQSSERRASGQVRGRSYLQSADEIQHRLRNDAAIETIMHGLQEPGPGVRILFEVDRGHQGSSTRATKSIVPVGLSRMIGKKGRSTVRVALLVRVDPIGPPREPLVGRLTRGSRDARVSLVVPPCVA
jgi:hypothetical protein